MLSPHTPPGTRVVCVDDDTDEAAVRRHFTAEAAERVLKIYDYMVSPYMRGATYVVRRIVRVEISLTGFGVRLEELPGTYPLGAFKPVELPGVLTELLNSRPKTPELERV